MGVSQIMLQTSKMHSTVYKHWPTNISLMSYGWQKFHPDFCSSGEMNVLKFCGPVLRVNFIGSIWFFRVKN